MKIKTRDLKGVGLDWAVATCEGHPTVIENGRLWLASDRGSRLPGEYQPSIKWELGGPIIDRERISIVQQTTNRWWAWNAGGEGLADTILAAAMICYVRGKLGREVEIPDELMAEEKPKTATQRYNECAFGVFGERLTDAEQQPGMLVRYGDGSTALAKLHSRHAGGWHGDQCMGGSTFIYGSIYKATALDHEIWNECAKWRKS